MSLERFHQAQADPQAGFPVALRELQSGRKSTHWIWYVFPQLGSLGRSPSSQYYGIADLEEACAYLRDPVLGSRLAAAVDIVAEQLRAGIDLPDLMGSHIDCLKLVSSLTLFQAAASRIAHAGSPGPWPAFDATCREILDRASHQGFPRCTTTLAALAPPAIPAD